MIKKTFVSLLSKISCLISLKLSNLVSLNNNTLYNKYIRIKGFSIPIRFSIPIPDSQALDSRFPIPNFSNSLFDSRFRFPGQRFQIIQDHRQKTGRFQFYFFEKDALHIFSWNLFFSRIKKSLFNLFFFKN